MKQLRWFEKLPTNREAMRKSALEVREDSQNCNLSVKLEAVKGGEGTPRVVFVIVEEKR